MKESGFAIRCPYCLGWNDRETHPDEIALDSEAELREILAGLEQDPVYTHPKLLRCQHPPWHCPARYEAFVCRNESDALQFIRVPNAWSLKRDFRLYKRNHRMRWRTHCGILFSTQAVPRLRDIELEHLLEREFLSRAIVGMGIELNGPVTVYAAQVFYVRDRSRTYWAPIEAYATGEPHLPPRYNLFCETVRRSVISPLLEQILGSNPTKCPIDFGTQGTCAGREPACLRGDWNHCPAFLELREKHDPCYQSDVRMIGKVERRWRKGGATNVETKGRCWSGLREFAFPIVVHDHLVGVIISGQCLLKNRDLREIDDLVRRCSVLDSSRRELVRIRDVLIGTHKPRGAEEGYTAQFRVSEEESRTRIQHLRAHTSSIAHAAEIRYREIRARSEAVFKQELLGHIENQTERADFS